ncbi:hypothetical protein J3R30DRAFT_1083296 [Lentinula aciculospora]|uniref:Uncharacterized protein n=1 Tax=Lentinula aciculospora TaxID=153920 RepID=A0A9W9A0H7_9AGAR|nr:hypothetical protein J3R30DRAFT_1083296 [Lentinula aciculospora]
MFRLQTPVDAAVSQIVFLGADVLEASRALKGLFARKNPTNDGISTDIVANLYTIEQILNALPQNARSSFEAESTQIASALNSASKQEKKLSLRRSVNLKHSVAAIYQKQILAQLEVPEEAEWKEAGEESSIRNIIPLRDSSLLACIGTGLIRPNDASDGQKVHLGLEGLKIGPLPVDWFTDPSDIDTKFQSLLDCMPAAYSKGKDAHAIAYDNNTQYIYVEFPAPIYAMYFTDNWSMMRADGLEKVDVTFFAT